MAVEASMPIILKQSIIRPLQESDDESLSHCANNPNVARFMADEFPSNYTQEVAKKWISIANPLHHFAIVHLITGDVMGGLFLDPGKDVHYRTAELGYYLGEEYWGRGIMSEVVPAIIDWAFSRFDGPDGLERICAITFDINAASERVVQKAGFIFEGRMRRFAYKNGLMMDGMVYSVIREDWDKKGEAKDLT